MSASLATRGPIADTLDQLFEPIRFETPPTSSPTLDSALSILDKFHLKDGSDDPQWIM